MVGAILQMVAHYEVLLAGRFLGGLGVGATSMLTPQFLAENAPKSIRGSMTATVSNMCYDVETDRNAYTRLIVQSHDSVVSHVGFLGQLRSEQVD